jgi:hypothetical protein
MATPDPSRPENPGPVGKMPVGSWVQMDIEGQGSIVGFTYIDAEAGFSLKGQRLSGTTLDQSAGIIVRLPMPGSPWRLLGPEEVQKLGLQTPPEWLKHYGPQPPAGTIWGWWQDHPRLKERFHPSAPDDLQVFVHDGGPRLTDRKPELVWVRVTGGEGNVFRGRVLNQPQQLVTVSEGSEIQFIAPESGEHPLLVTEKYLRERPDWIIQPCNRCGLSELFDAPSDLIRVVFPQITTFSSMKFTAFCGACGGTLVVSQAQEAPVAGDAEPKAPVPTKKWWQFWK